MSVREKGSGCGLIWSEKSHDSLYSWSDVTPQTGLELTSEGSKHFYDVMTVWLVSGGISSNVLKKRQQRTARENLICFQIVDGCVKTKCIEVKCSRAE